MHQGCLYKVVTVVMNTFPPTPVWSQHYQRYINTQQWGSPPRIAAVVGLINRLQIRAEYDTTLGVYPSRRSGSLAGSERLQWLCPPGLPSTSITTLSKCLLICFDRAPAAAEMDECVTSYFMLSTARMWHNHPHSPREISTFDCKIHLAAFAPLKLTAEMISFNTAV